MDAPEPETKRYVVVLTSEDEVVSHEVEWPRDVAAAVSALAQAVNEKATWSCSPKMKVLAVVDREEQELLELPDGRHLSVHPKSACEGEFCCVHNPSDHPMKSFPLLWRADRQLMERVCPHGTGHPDPDHIAHYAKTHTEDQTWAEGVHGCCGCCAPDSAATQGEEVA